MKRFNGICIITPDMGRLCNFYRELLQGELEGDETSAIVLTEGAELFFFNEQGMEQMLPNSMQGAGRGAYTLEFQVDDVDQEYERLVKMGVTVVKPPASYPWGRRSAWFRDPDGNIINFYAYIGAHKLSSGELVRAYFQRLLNEKDLSVCDEMLASEYIDHDAPAGTPPGPQNTKAFAAEFLEAYPDMHVEIEDLIAEKNRVAARITWRGTHRTSGELLYQMGIVLLRLNDQGQLVERWSTYAPPG